MVIEQIKNQLGRLVPVHKVSDLSIGCPHVEREMALVKVRGQGEKRVEALRIADIFRARVVDSTNESFVFEIIGDDAFGLHRAHAAARAGRRGAHRGRRHRPRPEAF